MNKTVIPQVLPRNYWITPEKNKIKKTFALEKDKNISALVISTVTRFFSKELSKVSENKFCEFQKTIEQILRN